MIFDIPHLISHVSGIMTLEEGDLILTGGSTFLASDFTYHIPYQNNDLHRFLCFDHIGTPAGVGPVKPGDKLEAGLEQSGTLIDHLSHPVIQRSDGFIYHSSTSKS